MPCRRAISVTTAPGRQRLLDDPHLVVARPATATLNPVQNFYPHQPTSRLALKPHASSQTSHRTRRPAAEGYFLGAGASRESKNAAGKQPPDANQLRDILAQKFFGKPMPNRDVMAVAEMAISVSGGSGLVYEAVRQAIDGFQPSPAHNLLTSFNWRMKGIASHNYGLRITATIFATELLSMGQDWKVSGGKRYIVRLYKINRFGMKAHYSAPSQANCKTVYTSSILVVASIFSST
jgi:hypothetical protein